MRTAALLLLAARWLAAADDACPVHLRGRTFELARLQSTRTAPAAVVFLPGDGGWRGAAISFARTIAAWGYDVFGFDTRKYLEAASRLSEPELAADMRELALQVSAASGRRVIFVGWSQGAGMTVAAISGCTAKPPLAGAVTLGLPESAVLGWDWKATLATLARREPDQPHFQVAPLFEKAPACGPVPLWMIQAVNDEYTTPGAAHRLFESAPAPKQYREIQGANHRFDGHIDELNRALKEGLAWAAFR